MDAALKLAIETYADLAKMTAAEVTAAIANGDEVIRRSVTMLLFSVA